MPTVHNPARAALSRVVARCIAEGAPIIEEQPTPELIAERAAAAPPRPSRRPTSDRT